MQNSKKKEVLPGITLESESLRLEFSSENGALTKMISRDTGWIVHRRPELGLSWRLLVPVNDELRNNPVYGEKQPVSSFETGEGFVRFLWNDVLSERAGRLPIRIVTEIRAEGRAAVWRTRVENQSPYTVESVYSPYIGDLSHPEDARWFRTFLPGYSSPQEWDLWPRFETHEGDHSTDFPTQFNSDAMGAGNPFSPWFLMRDEKQGLSASVRSAGNELVAWHCELRPGYGEAMDARVPETDEIAGKPVHIRFAPVHMCCLAPGNAVDLTPVALEAFTGGWQKGVDCYGRRRAAFSPTAEAPRWMKEPHAWLQLHVNSPEDELRMRFTELPRVAEECVKYGVRAIQLVGWNDGGQDQGNPSHDPDPRLGTREELREAIREIRAMGIKLILFVKFTWADRGTERFRKDLVRLAVKDPYGDYYMHGGYEYQTPAQLLGINTKRLIPMCFGSEEYLDLCCREFQKVLELEPDGILFDECCHHGPALLCFDPSHGHRIGWPVYANDLELVRRFRAVPGLPGDFLIAGEALYDREFEGYQLSYFRSRGRGHIPFARYLRPRGEIMTAVSGFCDRNMINQCLMDRYIISYEPYNFKGWLHDFPDTVAYGRKMDALRTACRDYLWDGTYRDTLGASVVTEDGTSWSSYARFEREDGRSALVAVNYGDEPVTVTASLESGTLSRWRTVDDETWHEGAGKIPIPPRSAVLVL